MPKKKSASSKGDAAPAPSFEEAMERIESIVEAMESDGLTLEDMLAKYEEGTALLRQCQERIESAQQRIELISAARENGSVSLREFEAESEAPKPTRTPTAPTKRPPQTADEDDDIRLF